MFLRLSGLAVLVWYLAATPATAADLQPQRFMVPPRLAAKALLHAETLTVPSIGCRPDGDISYNDNLVTLTLVAKVAANEIRDPGQPNGGMDAVSLRSYGGCLTGPVIETKPGSTLRLKLVNQLDVNDPSCTAGMPPGPGCFNTINMHYHGLHVSPAGNSDNVLLNIAPHTAFQYEVNIPADHPSGTFWYHPHRHGSTALQVASGASGALIIRGDRRYTGGAPGDIDTILHNAAGTPIPEQIFLFQQIPYACFDNGKIIQNADGTWLCPKGKTGVVESFEDQLASASLWDTSGRFTSINGAVQPIMPNVPAGQVQRWRFIHAGIHDTVNLQIVPMAIDAPHATDAAKGLLAGSAKAQALLVNQICPTVLPNDSKPVDLVPQFEIAADGLTRIALTPVGAGEKSVSGGRGSNYLQPGYRSDVLVVFPREGTYCILNQAATKDARVNPATRGGGGQGPNETQLLATVVVSGGTTVPGDLGEYVRQALYDGNAQDPGLPKAALEGLRQGDLSPWRGMPEVGPATNAGSPRQASFMIGRLDPTKRDTFGFYLNNKMYDPDRVDQTLEVNATEDWVLTSSGEPHIYHIHVNPFEVMDVLHNGQSVFKPNGECTETKDEFGLQNQYCHMWHQFKDTVFVQNDYEVHVRTTYDRYIGEFVMHCHILDHEDSGMMANVLIVPDVAAPAGGLGMAGMKSMSNGTMTEPMHH